MTTTTPAAAAAPEQDAPAQWAILELMGHQRLAGRVSQQTYGGASLIRVDVPEVVTTGTRYVAGEPQDVMEVIPAHTRSLGPSSVYSINWCDEAAATVAAHSIKHAPINVYSLKNVLRELPQEQRTKLLALAAPGSQLAEVATAVAASSSAGQAQGAIDYGDDDDHF